MNRLKVKSAPEGAKVAKRKTVVTENLNIDAGLGLLIPQLQGGDQ
jgi:hypothetical protein